MTALWRPTRYAEPSVDIDLPVAPEENRYLAAAVQNRYTAAPNRYTAAAPAPSRYANRYSSRYRRAGQVASPLRITRIIIAIPPPRPLEPDEELLWVPAWEYEQCFEEWEPDELWMPGGLINFDEALECMRWNTDEDDVCEIFMMTIDSEDDTFEPDNGFGDGVDMPIEQALRLRAQLAADPEWVMQILAQVGCWGPARWAGLPRHSVSSFLVVEAIRRDPVHGLGAAALDFLVWQQPEYCGPDGVRFREILTELEADSFIRTTPVENFLMHSGSLSPGTVPRAAYWAPKQLYPMVGEYVVTKIDYHSDLAGTLVAGWRSCWLDRAGNLDPER